MLLLIKDLALGLLVMDESGVLESEEWPWDEEGEGDDSMSMFSVFLMAGDAGEGEFIALMLVPPRLKARSDMGLFALKNH